MDLQANAEKAIRIVETATEVVFDTETSGLDWRFNYPVGYVIGAGENGAISLDDVVYVPVRHGGGGNLPGCRPLSSPTEGFEPHPFEAALNAAFMKRRALGVQAGRTVGHHMAFDVHMAKNGGIDLGRRLGCTQNMMALLNEYARSFSLSESALAHGVTPKKGDELYAHMSRLFNKPADKKVMSEFWRTAGTDTLVYEYTIGDGITTMELWWKQMQEILDQDLTQVADLENDLLWTVFRAERRGIKVDLSQTDALQDATERKITELLRSFPVGFNTRSPKQVQKVFDDAGLTDYPRTDIGNPSFTEKWMKKNELGKKIVEIRQASNLINSFIKPLKETHVFKGRVHATLNQLKSDDKGTISGRFSCNSPNLQQVPKHNKELAKPFRRLFVADEGYVFWERDYSQCEPRLFAHYAQEPNLLNGYNATPFVDAHTTVAKLLNVERDPTAKRMNMGILTGMQPKSFAGHMGWDLPKATEAFNAWFQKFPTIRQFQNNAKARILQRGYVFTLLGRRGRLESRQYAYRATSKIIQGSNADILKWKFLEVDRICEDNGDIVQILMTVHDSFNGQFQDTPEARALFKHICWVFEQVQGHPFYLAVPFVIEGEEGPNWSVATYGPDKVKANG